MKGMIEMTLRHISPLWVSNIAHVKLREPINIGCVTHVKEL